MTADAAPEITARSVPALGKRFFARWLDGLLLGSALLLAWLLLLYAVGDGRGAVDGFLWGLAAVAVVVAALYNQVWLTAVEGAGIGKRTAGIKVLDRETGLPLGFARTIGRELLFPLSVTALRDPLGQGLHDAIVGSVVVRDAWRQPELVARDADAARAALVDVSATPGSSKPDPILIAENISRSFGGLVAVDVDHLEIQRGVITALIGPNGAGKTTLFNLLTSFDRPTTGTKAFNGETIDDVPAHKIANYGMVRTFQLTKSLSKMSVLENMKLGATDQKGEGMFTALFTPIWSGQDKEIEARADELLARFSLDHMRDEFAGTLSGGQRKLLEMARALMVRPSLVMLDEPMAGVNPALKQSLLNHVKGLRDQGMTVVFVEHDMDMVQDISDWVVVMAEGRVIAEGPPASISDNQAVVDAYLGAHHDSALDLGDDS
jgi:branched-chain amino acid transport system ATP-binding protein